jgi:hypothetical protein
MNNQVTEKSFSAFLPVALLALASIILLTWNLIIVINQHSNGVRISAQQEIQLAQATQAEAKLKQMMTDLVEMAKDDTDAETIVKRYGIAFNPPENGTKALTPATTKAPVKAPATVPAKVPTKAPAKAPAKAPVEETTDK